MFEESTIMNASMKCESLKSNCDNFNNLFDCLRCISEKFDDSVLSEKARSSRNAISDKFTEKNRQF